MFQLYIHTDDNFLYIIPYIIYALQGYIMDKHSILLGAFINFFHIFLTGLGRRLTCTVYRRTFS